MAVTNKAAVVVDLALSVVAPQTARAQNAAAQLYYACQQGDRQSCMYLLRAAQQSCLNGDSGSCQLAQQLFGVAQSPGAAQRDPSCQFYGPNPSPYAQNPLAPYRDFLGETNDYM